MFDFEGYGPGIFAGALVTMELAFLSLFMAFTLGLAGAFGKLSHNRLPRAIATFYTTLIRGVPDLVWMMLLFYGGQILVNAFFDWLYDATSGRVDIFFPFNEFISGVLTIGFIFGAYMAETFRGAFLAVNAGQIEAGKAYGMNGRTIFRRILFPQMMRHAIPGIANNWQVLLKSTALVSVIGLSDMVRLATEAAKSTDEPLKFLIPVALVYLALAAASDLFFKKLTAYYSAGVAND